MLCKDNARCSQCTGAEQQKLALQDVAAYGVMPTEVIKSAALKARAHHVVGSLFTDTSECARALCEGVLIWLLETE